MTKILLSLVASVLSLSACMTSDDPEPATSSSESELTRRICTPGAQSCDWGCYYVGGPSTDDCIVRCNSTGTGYVLIQNCGYAQNWPYSSSCREGQPPVCEWN